MAKDCVEPFTFLEKMIRSFIYRIYRAGKVTIKESSKQVNFPGSSLVGLRTMLR